MTMTLTTFIVMGVGLALLFVMALVAVFYLNRQDRLESRGFSVTGQYGQQPQGQYGQQPQGQYGQQPGQYGQQPGQYGQQPPDPQ